MDHEIRVRSRAFTLVELLVVLAVIAVLAGLLLPVLSSVHESNNIAHCSSNMRQVFGALSLYVQDHGNALPQRYYGSDSSGNPVGYPEVILGYIDAGHTPQHSTTAQKLYTCPDQKQPDYPTEPGYGMNWFYDNVNVAQVPQPAQTILLAETLGTSGQGSRRADRDNGSGEIGALDITRHRAKANYIFFDGHMSSLTYTQTRQPLSPSTDPNPPDMWGTDHGNHSQPVPTPPY